jgi:cobaltochelatase CobT
VPARNGWDGAQEEGCIDGRVLARLIASPTERRLFRIERQEPMADCVVSFLIDCSGSMKQHIESVAMLVDVFARALDQAGVASEVLGFSTGAWNGGRALRDWQQRRPAQAPGPAQRGLPHGLQGRRHALAPRAA